MGRTPARRGAGLVALAALLACLLSPGAASAENGWSTVRRVADGTFDVLVLRTSGLAMFVVGVGLFVPAVILTSPGGMTPIRETWDRFVITPTGYVFTRPIGDF